MRWKTIIVRFSSRGIELQDASSSKLRLWVTARSFQKAVEPIKDLYIFCNTSCEQVTSINVRGFFKIGWKRCVVREPPVLFSTASCCVSNDCRKAHQQKLTYAGI